VIPISLPLTASSLKTIDIFSNFSDTELTQLLSQGQTVQFEAQTNIIIEGELSWGFYLILEGMLGVSKNNKLTGNFYDLGELRAGNFFGEMSLIDANARSATVKSLTAVNLFFISKERFLSFLNQSTQLTVSFYTNCIKALVNRLRELDDNYVISQYQLWQFALTHQPGDDSK
jgi:CRP-like cAMP-binding protein